MKTNFQMLCDFAEYEFKHFGFISNEESKKVKEHFCIAERSNIDLQNLRDFVVMFYGNVANSKREKGETEESFKTMDKMSAIVAVIDDEKWNRGMEV